MNSTITKIRNAVSGFFAKGAGTPVELDSAGQPWFWQAGYVPGYTFSSYSMREFVLNGYAKNPFVFMCADKIASVSAQLDWDLVDETTMREVNNPELIELLSRPNESQTWDDFYYEVVVSLQVTGNVFIRKETAIGFSRPTHLRVLVPYLVDIYTVGLYKDNPVDYYTYDGVRIEPEEIIHIKYSNLVERTNWGLSKLQAGIQVYETSNNIFGAEAHMHKNLGVTGVLSNKDGNAPMLPKEQSRLQEAWNRMATGIKKFGSILVTTASLDYQKLGMSPEDLQTLEGQLAKMRTICSLFGLDSSLFNDPDNKTFANRHEAEVSMYETVIKPTTEKINRALSRYIVQDIFKVRATIVADFENVAVLMRAKTDAKLKKQQYILSSLQAQIITPEEARAILHPELK